jgi:hypothetical protein
MTTRGSRRLDSHVWRAALVRLGRGRQTPAKHATGGRYCPARRRPDYPLGFLTPPARFWASGSPPTPACGNTTRMVRTRRPPVMPDAVAFVETTEEVAKLLALCHAERIPVVPWGAGTSLEGHVTPVRGGITLDLSRMTKIIDVSQPDMDCRVEAGVTRDQLNAHLRDLGLFFPVDPGTSPAPSAACARPAPRAPTRCVTAPCGRTRWV